MNPDIKQAAAATLDISNNPIFGRDICSGLCMKLPCPCADMFAKAVLRAQLDSGVLKEAREALTFYGNNPQSYPDGGVFAKKALARIDELEKGVKGDH